MPGSFALVDMNLQDTGICLGLDFGNMLRIIVPADREIVRPARQIAASHPSGNQITSPASGHRAET